MWNWRLRQSDLKRANAELEEAHVQKAEAYRRQGEVKMLAEKSNEVTAKLKREAEINGFTRLLQSAMERRK